MGGGSFFGGRDFIQSWSSSFSDFVIPENLSSKHQVDRI